MQGLPVGQQLRIAGRDQAVVGEPIQVIGIEGKLHLQVLALSNRDDFLAQVIQQHRHLATIGPVAEDHVGLPGRAQRGVDQAQPLLGHAEQTQGEVLGQGEILAVTRAQLEHLQRRGPVVELPPQLLVLDIAGLVVEEPVDRLELLGLAQRQRVGNQIPPGLQLQRGGLVAVGLRRMGRRLGRPQEQTAAEQQAGQQVPPSALQYRAQEIRLSQAALLGK
ncbi:hypothetical protein D3C78_1075450 [compost metagenome]